MGPLRCRVEQSAASRENQKGRVDFPCDPPGIPNGETPVARPIVSREYGIFSRWPEDGVAWIHPEDVGAVEGLLPSDRIFLRIWDGSEWAVLHYGQVQIRIHPTLWEIVTPPEYDVGDEVEVRSLLKLNEPGPAIIREVLWDRHHQHATYEIEQHGMVLPRHFLASDLRPVTFLQSASNKKPVGPTLNADASEHRLSMADFPASDVEYRVRPDDAGDWPRFH